MMTNEYHLMKDPLYLPLHIILRILHSTIFIWKELAYHALLHILILQTLEIKLEDLRALTPYIPYKEKGYIHRIFGQLYIII